ncbi:MULTISPECIES: ABC-three component system middle component 1 [Sporomusa]|uniref:ABC-three component system middle component 1 n=1 Tax=Sporomusa TaxID=2375 RepID=UPI003159332A
MEAGSIEVLLSDYLLKFDLIKKIDEEMKYTKHYYIDKEIRRYILYPFIFNSKQEIISKWQLIQNEDIAIRLQSQLFPYKDIRWDMYFLLIYNGEDDIADDEIIAIERNKFCCKKLYIDARTKENIEGSLKAKLPFTSDYYPQKDTLILSEQDFLIKLREVASLGDDFTDEIFQNATKEPEKLGELLKKTEVNLVEKL